MFNGNLQGCSMVAVNLLSSLQSISTVLKRCEKKRGPEKNRLKVKIYYLVYGEPVPLFSKIDRLIEAHMSHGHAMFINKYHKSCI